MHAYIKIFEFECKEKDLLSLSTNLIYICLKYIYTRGTRRGWVCLAGLAGKVRWTFTFPKREPRKLQHYLRVLNSPKTKERTCQVQLT